VLDTEMPPVFSFDGLPAREILDVVRRGLNSPLTSSMGRLFDAVAFMLGCGARVSYEAEAAVALEALALGARGGRRSYPFAWKSGGFIAIDSAPVVEAVLDDLRKRRERSEIAAAFHRGVAKLVLDLLAELSRLHGCTDCVISGGVFQNRFLCECVMEGAASSPLRLYQHSLVPPNDGGISLGQLAVGVSQIARRRE
jgi:hydrogenase maturation protein HypF